MFEDLILEKHLTGSNYICDPPVTDTDIDFVCLVNEGDLKVAKAFAIADGWELCGKEYETPGDFLAFRKEKLNYICVDSEEKYNKWIEATEKAKEQNLIHKEDRIKLFNSILGTKIRGMEYTKIIFDDLDEDWWHPVEQNNRLQEIMNQWQAVRTTNANS